MTGECCPKVKMLRRGRLSRVEIMGIATIGLILGLAYSRLLRILAVPNVMRYVPEENGALVASGDIASLYQAFDAHFPELVAKNGANELAKFQAEAGIDKRAGILVSTPGIFDRLSPLVWRKGVHFDQQALEKKTYLAVVPLADRAAFLKSLGDQFPNGPKRSTIDGASGRFEVLGYGDSLLVALPETQTALISNSRALLERSLLRQQSNLEHARNNDGLYHALRQYLRRPMLSGPSLLVAEEQDPATLRRADTVLAFGDTSIDLNSHLDFANRQIAVVENVFRPAPAPELWAASLPYRTAAALTLQDDALARYLRFISQFDDARRSLEEWYGGLLWRLQNVSQLRRVTLAVTGYEDGLPDLLAGFWGDTHEIESIFAQMRAEFQQARARELGDASTRTEAGQSDQIQHGDRTIRFLIPKLTADDLRLRPEFQGLSGIALTGDRYRLAYATSRDVCWVATKVDDLAQLLDRQKPGTASLADNPVYRAAAAKWTGGEKLQFYMNLDQVMVLGMLSPESRVETWVKNKLRALREHPVISMELNCPARNLARLHVMLHKRLKEPE